MPSPSGPPPTSEPPVRYTALDPVAGAVLVDDDFAQVPDPGLVLSTGTIIVVLAAIYLIMSRLTRGLDTSVLLSWIKDTYQAEMIAFCANIGQEEELKAKGSILAASFRLHEIRHRIRITFIIKLDDGRIIGCRE